MKQDQSSPAPDARLLLTVSFLAGWVLMQLEITGGRLLAPFFGHSIYQWGALIGVVMTAMSLGYAAGGRLGDRPRAVQTLLLVLAACALFTAAVPLHSEFVVPSFRRFGPAWGAVGASAALLGIPAFLLATISPIVIRLTSTGSIAYSAGRVYAISTVGSIGGTFFTAFYAIPQLGSRVSVWVAAGILAIAVLALALSTRRVARGMVTLLLLSIAATVAMDPPRSPGVVYRSESVHNLIRVEEAGSWRRVWLDDDLATVMNQDSLLTGSYDDFFLLGPQLSGGDRVLFLGVAGGNALYQLVETYPQVKVTGVELDPELIDVAHKYFRLAGEDRVRLQAGDARWFLRTDPNLYDIVAIDLFVSRHIPFFLSSREFFKASRERLDDGGILMMNVLSAGNPEPLIGPFLRTLDAVFPSVFQFNTGGNHILIASRDHLALDEIQRRLAQPGITGDVEEVLRRARPLLRIARPDPAHPVFTDDRSDVEFRTYKALYGKG